MKNLLALAAFVGLLVVAVGYFLGWYHFKTETTPTGQNRVTIDIDAQKVKQDVKNGEQKVEDMLKKKTTTPGTGSNAPEPPPLPGSVNTKYATPPAPPMPEGGTNWNYHPDPNTSYDKPPAIPPIPPTPPSVPESVPIPTGGDNNYTIPPTPPGIPLAPKAAPGAPSGTGYFPPPPGN